MRSTGDHWHYAIWEKNIAEILQCIDLKIRKNEWCLIYCLTKNIEPTNILFVESSAIPVGYDSWFIFDPEIDDFWNWSSCSDLFHFHQQLWICLFPRICKQHCPWCQRYKSHSRWLEQCRMAKWPVLKHFFKNESNFTPFGGTAFGIDDSKNLVGKTYGSMLNLTMNFGFT